MIFRPHEKLSCFSYFVYGISLVEVCQLAALKSSFQVEHKMSPSSAAEFIAKSRIKQGSFSFLFAQFTQLKEPRFTLPNLHISSGISMNRSFPFLFKLLLLSPRPQGYEMSADYSSNKTSELIVQPNQLINELIDHSLDLD